MIFLLTSVLAVPVPLGDLERGDGGLPALSSDWRIEVVDSEGEIGGWNSLDLDGEGNPHISYYDATNRDLKYARRNGGSWLNETVDSEGWLGQTSSLAVDSRGYPHISYYYDVGGHDLRHANWTGINWSIETVDSVGNVGMYSSIAIDSNDRPHISYWDRSKDDLKYARWNGTWWAGVEIVDKGGSVGEHTALALDGMDNPHITYRDYSNNDLKYAFKAEGKWNFEVVDYSGMPASYYNSIAIDGRNDPHASYLDGNELFKYAKRTGGLWSFEIVDYDISRGESPSLALDSNDNPHISFSGNGSLNYATRNGTAWEFEIVDYVGGPIRSSLALDTNDDPHISYFTKVNGDLMYATKADLTPSHSVSLDINPNTLNLKSKGRWITAYLSAENASVSDINISSILLQDTLIPERWDYQGDMLMLKFNRQELIAMLEVGESVEIKLSGKWKDGTAFEAYDYIRVINPGKE